MWIYQKLSKAFAKLPVKAGFEDLIYVQTPAEVLAEVKRIVSLFLPHFDANHFERAFSDTLKLFAGHWPGYRRCNTRYHDLTHTMDCLLVMARLMYGATVNGITFTTENVNLGLISALMHDTGYIQTVDDLVGTGAKYTLIHIDRSIDFMETYLQANGYSRADFEACRNFLRCTGIEVKIKEIEFQSFEQEILGKMLGAADLIGQMSDKKYLEKLPLLYREFNEGGVGGFSSEVDLLRQTPGFWEVVKMRFAKELGGVDRYLKDYFWALWGLDQDLYRKAIESNIEGLRSILRDCHVDYATSPGCKVPLMQII